MLSQYTPADGYVLLLYLDLQEIHHFIMFYLQLSQNFVYLKNFESIPLWYSQTEFFAADK